MASRYMIQKAYRWRLDGLHICDGALRHAYLNLNGRCTWLRMRGWIQAECIGFASIPESCLIPSPVDKSGDNPVD